MHDTSGAHRMKGGTKSTHQRGACKHEDHQLSIRKHTAPSNVLRQIGTACGTTYEEKNEHSDVVLMQRGMPPTQCRDRAYVNPYMSEHGYTFAGVCTETV